MTAVSRRYVLDSFALLAVLQREPGQARVEAILEDAAREATEAYLCLVNYGEILYTVERDGGLLATKAAISYIDSLALGIVDVDRRLTFAAAHIKAHHRLSFADAFAVATAQRLGATVVTGDPEFKAVQSLVAVEWL